MEDSSYNLFNRIPKDKRERLLHASIEEFAEHGFHQASINRLVNRLGIAKGSIFRYFGSKERLFAFVFDYAIELVKARLRGIRDITKEMPFFQRLKSILWVGINFVEQHPSIYRLYLKMIFQENFPLRDELLRKVHLMSAEYLTSLVRDSISKGEIRNDLDVDFVVFFLNSMLDRFLQAYTVAFWDAGTGIYKAPQEELLRKVDHFVSVIEKGLAIHE
ncbi:MAG: TetR/AcrR family transcriptional regulator [Syntrophobacterales bacterium]|nr:TetR/AcrR family transcriptional regulator [Syntrophobacterales bacterium]